MFWRFVTLKRLTVVRVRRMVRMMNREPDVGRLRSLGKRLRATMNASDAGPLLVAAEVMTIAAQEQLAKKAAGRPAPQGQPGWQSAPKA